MDGNVPGLACRLDALIPAAEGRRPDAKGPDFGVNTCAAKSYATASDQALTGKQAHMNVSHPKMFSSWHTLSLEPLTSTREARGTMHDDE